MSEKEVFYWYIFRISYRNERKVKDVLEIAGIETYIPFHTVQRSWNDAKHEIEIPVFTGIGFARVSDFDLEILKMMNEISLFTDKDGHYLTIPEELKEQFFEKPDMLPEIFLPVER